jgi:hypothetical protein
MWRKIITWLVSLVCIFVLAAPPAFGQRLENRYRPGAPKKDDDEDKRGPPALQYAVASFSAILVLVILCMPSRKRIVQ